ncbi:unnamed protein product, partial [Polarella glacialis]
MAPSSSRDAAAERKPHDAFIALRSEVFGREGVQQRVLSHVASAQKNQVALALRGRGPQAEVLQLLSVQRSVVSFLAGESQRILVLEGEAGAGKSALIASCARQVQQVLPHLKIFCHFVGAARGSTDLVRLLQRLWLELAPDLAVPPSEEGLLRGAADVLERAGQEGGLVILVDALNQLDADAEQSQLQWLPAVLPAGVHAVVSVIPGTPCHKILVSRSPEPLRIQVCGLDRGAGEKLVCSVLAKTGLGERSGEHCVELLLDRQGARNPLWLVFACEELKSRVWHASNNEQATSQQIPHVYTKLATRDRQTASITSNQSSAAIISGFDDDLLGLLQQILARIEKENEETGVVAALCFLECARHGLL